MFSLIRFSRQKMPAVIAILAILLLFVAPEVSKTLEHRRMENREEHSHASASDNMHDMHTMMAHGSGSGTMDDMSMSDADMHMHHDTPASAMDHSMPGMPMHHAGGMLDDIACGYCVMLIHLPLMLCLFVAIVCLMMKASAAPPPRIITFHITPFFPGTAQPRAPPLL